MKIHPAVVASFAALLVLGGCSKIKNPFAAKEKPPESTPVPSEPAEAPAPKAKPSTTAQTKPAKVDPAKDATLPTTSASAPADPAPAAPASQAIDKTAQVIILCYHRLEGKAGGALSIEPALFEQHLQELKDKNLPVISMPDFLAWRRGEKSIPPRAVIITIDDGYESGYRVGVPLLKKYGYPATFYIYTNYVNTGGKSMSWDQLADLRDQGFDIGGHTVSHQDLRRKPSKAKFADYDSWLKDELETSKSILEERLGIRVATLAYPYGLHNSKVQAAAKAAGYDVAVTTYGQRIGHDAAPYTIGRYDVTAKDAQKRDGFTAGVLFQGPAASSAPVVAQDAQALMVTEPMNGAVINEAKPTVRANLASLGALDASTVEMRVSGFGLVPAQYDPNSKAISYSFQQPLRPGLVTVIVAGKAKGQRVETRWSFKYDPAAKPSEDPASSTELPPRRTQ